MRFNERDASQSGQLDFVPRERRRQIWKLIIAFAVTICLILVIARMPGLGGRDFAPFLSSLLIATLCFYVVYTKQKTLDLLMSAEYQNLLFSQAVRLGSSFALFVRRDGTVVYASEGLRQLFPHFAYSESQALEEVFEQGGVSKPDRERILAAIYSNTNERLIFPIQPLSGPEKDYILTVEPIARPAGFALVRAREYLGQRSGLQLLPDVLRATSADKLDHMLATTPTPHYTTDAFGRLEYVNPAFEHWLGYATGALTEQPITVQQLLAELDGAPVPQDYVLRPHQAPVTLRQRDGGRVTALLVQHVLRDAAGKPLGATGSLLAAV